MCNTIKFIETKCNHPKASLALAILELIFLRYSAAELGEGFNILEFLWAYSDLWLQVWNTRSRLVYNLSFFNADN